jgi:hypothetical protein
MADLLCVKCSQPILSTDARSTIEQVDACTMSVERVTYHAACRDGTGDAPSKNTRGEPGRTAPAGAES